MQNDISICQPELDELKPLYRSAFPDEDLFPLVRELTQDQASTFALCARDQGKIIGQIAFSACHGEPSNIRLSLLGPLAIHPDHQRAGRGSALINEGFRHLANQGTHIVLVLGDPNYYGRFGFTKEENLQTPFAIPEEWENAWQSATLIEPHTSPTGKLNVSQPWQHEKYWN